ncbi:aquaporin-11 isoform X2 [Anolis carolinensis]|uniref:aquaporin-11 isoform X2 n=1 Tax=Anolis carolinensis TaxID=28377 RepID=UPI000203A6DE
MEKTQLVAIQGATTVIATEGRRMTRLFITPLSPRLFLMEMLATFQLCVGFNVLRPLAEKETYLGHLYSFAALHFYLTLSENPTNPTTTLVHILRKGISMKLGVLTIVAQFVGAFVAAVYQNVLWARGILELLSDPHVCSYPLQTNLLKAFGTELVSSFLFQLTLLKSEEQEIRVRANMIAIALTSLVYAGGHLTGAIFNPALAFSMHLNCFSEKFWNYILVYWIAPCLGSVLVVIAWDEILPLLHREA